jgi:hypothetical protein
MPRFRRALAATALAAALGLAAHPAFASIEEFANFDVLTQEEDDESLLDHLLTRTPQAWRSEWERAPMALRTAQGCLTSGQWFLVNELKLSSALGTRARFGVNLDQSESDETAYDNLDLSFRYPTRFGTPGMMFRPLHDKSRQDVALLWEAGADTTAWRVETAFTFEDLFNNLWAFRQTRVGNRSESYERHPFEPALRAAVRHEAWRAELSGKVLTPSTKRIVSELPGGLDRRRTLWGTLAGGAVEAQALGVTWEARGTNRQATGTEQAVDGSDADGRKFRRQWQAELAGRTPLGARGAIELRGVYASRTQSSAPPFPAGRFDALDRVLLLESDWRLGSTAMARIGVMHDRISVFRTADMGFSYGSRTESRAYVGLTAKFGRVSISGVEGIELDPEPYEVWLVHDKGFLHLQTTF